MVLINESRHQLEKPLRVKETNFSFYAQIMCGIINFYSNYHNYPTVGWN